MSFIVIIQAVFYYKERRDLLNRIMANDWQQYQVETQTRPPPKSRSTINFRGESEGGE